jgi:glycosyltransferase involved in cell wall biosynthesis
MKTIVFVANIGLVVDSFIKDYLISLSSSYNVILIYNTIDSDKSLYIKNNITVIHYDIKRKYSFSDFKLFFFLFKCLNNFKADVVISITPKIAFLAHMAAFIARIKIRIHFFTGQLWYNKIGFMRFVYKKFDKLIFGLVTHRLIDSVSQRNFLHSEGFNVELNTFTYSPGSICGVDYYKFAPNNNIRKAIRERLGLKDEIVFLYLGRIDREKGIDFLISSFKKLAIDNICLLLVGPDEMEVEKHLANSLSSSKIIYIPFTNVPQHYYAASDIFCYLSEREGFGLAVAEASASALPVIGSKIVGLTDAIIDNETGFLVNTFDANEVILKMTLLANSNKLRTEMGIRGRKFVMEKLSKNIVVDQNITFIKNSINS